MPEGRKKLQHTRTASPEPHRPLWETVLQFGEIGYFYLDGNLCIRSWNSVMERLYNIREAEVKNRALPEVFEVFVDREKVFIDKIRQALASGEAVQLPGFRHRSKKKGVRTINFLFLPEQNGEEPGVHVLVRDITDLLVQRQRLDEYQQYITNILRDAADAIIVLDEENRIRLWNRGAEMLYGWKASEIVGKPITVIVPDDPESVRQIEWINQEVREKGFVRNLQAERRTRDGRIVTISITRTAIRDRDGRYIGSSVIARNITEEKRMEQQLIQSEKLSAVGKLAAGIAHEVVTPLTSISSLAQYLREMTDQPEFKEKLRLIQSEIDRIARTVRELVDFSRPIEGTVSTVSLNQIIREAVRIVRFDRRLKRRDIAMKLSPELPLVRAGFDPLLQVFVNLLLNAADALEDRSDGKIFLSTGFEKGFVVATVQDNGVGIPPELQGRIFEPFFTTKKKGKGTGLGLWVSYNIIRGYAGHIEVESIPGKETTFRIRLPVAPENSESSHE